MAAAAFHKAISSEGEAGLASEIASTQQPARDAARRRPSIERKTGGAGRAVAAFGSLLYSEPDQAPSGHSFPQLRTEGHVAEWLRNGLQNRVPRFNSGRGLQQPHQIPLPLALSMTGGIGITGGGGLRMLPRSPTVWTRYRQIVVPCSKIMVLCGITQ